MSRWVAADPSLGALPGGGLTGAPPVQNEVSTGGRPPGGSAPAEREPRVGPGNCSGLRRCGGSRPGFAGPGPAGAAVLMAEGASAATDAHPPVQGTTGGTYSQHLFIFLGSNGILLYVG
jgi:hypothetical protein